MASVLIAYASTHGHTAKICRRIADVLRDAGLGPDLRDIGTGDDPDPGRHRGAIVAASVHRGSHQPEVLAWTKRHRESLADVPSAFMSVSLTAAEDDEESRSVTAGLIDSFIAETGWTPRHTTAMAGALQYLEYDSFTRTLMRLLMKRGGHPTDTSHDYDYTDWDAVESFARGFASRC